MDWPDGLVTKALGSTGSSAKWLAQVLPVSELGLQPVGAWSIPTVMVPPSPVTHGMVDAVDVASAPEQPASRTNKQRNGVTVARCHLAGRPPEPVTAAGGPA